MCNDNSKIISQCKKNLTLSQITNITFSEAFIPITLGVISVNSRDFTCPKILITFSGEILSGPNTRTFNDLIFRVMKTCNGITRQVSGNLGSGIVQLLTSITFSYQICDLVEDNCSCSDEILYTIELLPGIISSPDTITITNLTITSYISEKSCPLFQCSTGNTISFVSSTPGKPITLEPLDIGSINLDVSCFKNPKLLIAFSGDITATGSNTILPTFFRIIRNCDCSSTILPIMINGPFFNFFQGALLQPVSFYFQFEDKDIKCCSDLMKYKIQILSNIPISPTLSFAMSNVVISAFISEDQL